MQYNNPLTKDQTITVLVSYLITTVTQQSSHFANQHNIHNTIPTTSTNFKHQYHNLQPQRNTNLHTYVKSSRHTKKSKTAAQTTNLYAI
eukprot:gene2912-1894_t